MWRRGWSGANLSMVSPRGRCCSGGNHNSRGSHGGAGGSDAGAATVGGAAAGLAMGGGEEWCTRGRKALPP